MGIEDGAGHDPFRGLVLDEEFVAAARYREPTVVQRARRSSNDAGPRPGTQRGGGRARGPGRSSGLARVRPLMVLGVLLVAMAAPGSVHGGTGPAVERLSGRLSATFAAGAARPTPRPAESRTPLGEPTGVPGDGGPHHFSAVQADGVTPVAYDPCRPVGYAMNDRTQPGDARGLVEEAVDLIADATGLHFVHEGPTDEAPVDGRAAFQPDRYGDRWAPVLIAWSDPSETPELAGEVAGMGGSTAISTPGHPDVYVSGVVVLDGPQLADGLAAPDGRESVRAVIAHELGHLVGLDHVDDPTQLMHPRATQVHLHTGDLAGLHQLGSGPCLPLL